MLMTPTARGPFCQSCGKPLARHYDFGTAADGIRINDYCNYCYEAGQFTAPEITVEQMIEQAVDFLSRQTLMSKTAAQAWASKKIPELKRWHLPKAS